MPAARRRGRTPVRRMLIVRINYISGAPSLSVTARVPDLNRLFIRPSRFDTGMKINRDGADIKDFNNNDLINVCIFFSNFCQDTR